MQASLLNPADHASAAADFIRFFGITGEQQSLAHVTAILQHFARLPYENISKIINLNQHFDRPPYRLPDMILGDHERYRLGGTCFSLTFFLKSILDYFDYQTEIIMADMRSGKNTHCALILTFQATEYLIDPGYLLHRPLPLASRQPIQVQKNSWVSLQYDPDENCYTLHTIKNQRSTQRYRFIHKSTSLVDFQQHWDQSFHWMTMHGICLSRRDREGFIYLHNHYLRQESGHEQFKGHFDEDIDSVVARHFGIPREIIRQAESALRENMHFDKELGFRVPQWVK